MAERFYSGREDGVSVREGVESRQLDPRFDLDPEQQHPVLVGHEKTRRATGWQLLYWPTHLTTIKWQSTWPKRLQRESL